MPFKQMLARYCKVSILAWKGLGRPWLFVKPILAFYNWAEPRNCHGFSGLPVTKPYATRPFAKLARNKFEKLT